MYIYIIYTCLTQSQHGIFSLGGLRSGTFEKLWIELVEATFLSHLLVAVWQFLGSVNVRYMGVVQFRGASQSTQQSHQHWDFNYYMLGSVWQTYEWSPVMVGPILGECCCCCPPCIGMPTALQGPIFPLLCNTTAIELDSFSHNQTHMENSNAVVPHDMRTYHYLP